MKLKLLSKLFFAFGFFCYSSGVSGEHIAPVNSLQIPYASQSITFNGIDDEACWSELQTTEVFNPMGWSGVSDYTLTFRVCYDKNFLYVFCEIFDDVENDWDWGLPNQWTYDNVDVYVDLDTTYLDPYNFQAYDTNTNQVRFCRGIDSVEFSGRASRSEFKYFWNNTASGWVFETGIPWSFVLGPGQVPEDILKYFEEGVISGFDLMGSDSDGTGPDQRDVQTAWDEDGPQTPDDRTEDNAWNSRNVFGVVEFLPEGAITDPYPYIPQVKRMIIPARTDLIKIDGKSLENSYSATQNLSAFNANGIMSTFDLSGYFKATFDAKYLYFFSLINDNINNSWSGNISQEDVFDNLELYVDLDTNHNSSAYDENTHMLRFHRGVDTLSDYGNADKKDFLISVKNTAGNAGWTIEAAIPWASFMPVGSSPEEIENYVMLSFGFDVIVNDSDGGFPSEGAVDGQLAWDRDDPNSIGDHTEETADTNVFAFGIVKLTGTMLPAPPPPAPKIYCSPVKNDDIPAVSNGTIIIDGIKDNHSWSPTTGLSLFNGNGYDGINDISATLSYCWNYSYLYVFADITDNSELVWDGFGNMSDFDNVEVFIDLDTSNNDVDYGENTIRLIFNRGYNSIENPGRALSNDFSIYAQNRIDSDGWIMEAAIPWTSSLPEGSESDAIKNLISKTIGFDIHVNDCDNIVSSNNKPDKQLAWDLDDPAGTSDLTENMAFSNRLYFGLITLTGTPTGTQTVDKKSKYVFAPNPAINSITISNLTIGSRIEILSILGESKCNKIVVSDTEIIEISGLNAGIYIIQITDDNLITTSMKFIKR